MVESLRATPSYQGKPISKLTEKTNILALLKKNIQEESGFESFSLFNASCLYFTLSILKPLSYTVNEELTQKDQLFLVKLASCENRLIKWELGWLSQWYSINQCVCEAQGCFPNTRI